MRTLEAVEPSFFADAPAIITTHNFVEAERDAVFASISGDPAGWGDWFPGFNHAGRWETPQPQGVGSIRTVEAFRTHYRETILAWDPGTRWAFRVDSTDSPMFDAFAEDYRLFDAGPGTLLSWTMAYRPSRAMRLAAPLAPAMFRLIARRMASGLTRVAGAASGS
jgi:hypothetical protein